MSLRFVYGDKNSPEINAALIRFVMNETGRRDDFGPAMTLGIAEGGRMLGVVVFHDYIPERGTIEFSAVSSSAKWLNKKVIKEIARLAFELNDCQMMFARCDADYGPTNRILSALKFQKIVLPNMRGRRRDEAVFIMTRDAWSLSRLSK